MTIEEDLALTKEELRGWRQRANRAESLLMEAHAVLDKIKVGISPDKRDAITAKLAAFLAA